MLWEIINTLPHPNIHEEASQDVHTSSVQCTVRFGNLPKEMSREVCVYPYSARCEGLPPHQCYGVGACLISDPERGIRACWSCAASKQQCRRLTRLTVGNLRPLGNVYLLE